MVRRVVSLPGHGACVARTLAETILWRGLRDRGIGAKFRRQVPIGCVADFVCIAARMIVELDGPPHDEPEQHRHDVAPRRVAPLAGLARAAIF